MLTSCNAHVGLTLHVLMYVFQLLANWLGVFLYNELYSTLHKMTQINI